MYSEVRAAEPAVRAARPVVRARVQGKFLYAGDEKLYLCGVTYGPFRPDETGCQYHDRASVERDFALMAAFGLNVVRVYTVPPRWLLDVAQGHGLRVMIGIPWVQNVAFFENKGLMRDCLDRLNDAVWECRGHPALLAYTLGNEIPAPVVRWYGHRRIERHLKRMYRLVKKGDPGALVTYVNYPTTEYLDLPFLDFVSFNVYLETPEKLKGYLSRLQNIAGERPLVMAEIGLDSLRNGEERQAEVMRWQIETAFAAGCAGIFVFSWTDEWFREGHDITDWKFGLTDIERRPKAALAAVSEAFSQVPFRREAAAELPEVSVVCCTYNGSRTIRQTLEALTRLDYPDYEVIVIDDGSKDGVHKIAEEFPVRLIRTVNKGLSAARNRGVEEARGQIVAYIDDDAYPDPQWLSYLVRTLKEGKNAGAGGPNFPVPGDGAIAECVAASPGGPTHVLLTDTIAEHIPGCNMAFWRSALQQIGGFDTQFRIAGDDVDICWRLQEAGWTLGFSPAAVVWHHRRNSVKAYWRQQKNYGKAEADLERKWPQKYNAVGHPTWNGRLYDKGSGMTDFFFTRRRIYHGVWGGALFQQVYHIPPGLIWQLPMMPEWYVITGVLLALSILGAVWWTPLLVLLPLLLLAGATSTFEAVWHATRVPLNEPRTRWQRISQRVLTAFMYRMQPLARLIGRFRYGLTPWRDRGTRGISLPVVRHVEQWCKDWQMPAERLGALEKKMREAGVVVLRGDDFARWDLEVQGGLFGAVRIRLLTEDLAYGAQLVRLRAYPKFYRLSVLGLVLFALLCPAALWDGRVRLAAVFAGVWIWIAWLAAYECGAAMATFLRISRDEGAK